MPVDVAASPTVLAGRSLERRLLLDQVREAGGGMSCAWLVHGDAGVGKTSLVRSVADEVATEGVTVLRGTGLRFAAVETTCLPLVMALEGWRRSVPAQQVDALLGVVREARQLFPSLGGTTASARSALVTSFDAVLTVLSEKAPVLLVVDDVQWADAVSRDALTYVLAGSGRRRLAMLLTCRDEPVADDSALAGWLADLRRLPGVHRMDLRRLDVAGTEQQLRRLFGRPAHPRLVAEVHERSAGVPFLTELLVDGIDRGAERLPEGLPDLLTQVMLDTWQRLVAPSRQVLQVLAVAGAPVDLGDLVEVCATVGLQEVAVHRAVVDGTAAGIAVVHDRAVWFRHPLVAETLVSTVLPPDAAHLHASWAALLARTPSTGIDELRRRGAVAAHLEQAGDRDAALAASLDAAELAHDLGALRVEARHLRRAADAWPRGGAGEVELLERAARACALTGEQATAITLLDRALDRLDPVQDPLAFSRLSIARAEEEWFAGGPEDGPAEVARLAVERCSAYPDSREYAEALADLSGNLVWRGDAAGAAHYGDLAIEAAVRSQAPEALCIAHETRAYSTPDEESCERHSRAALRFARECEDPGYLSAAVIARSNYFLDNGHIEESTALHEEALRNALDNGATSLVVGHAAEVARRRVEAARFDDAERAIREGLVRPGAAHGTADIRIAATLLAVRRGDLPSADQHMARAYELVPTLAERPGMWAPPSLAEHLLAHRDAAGALGLLERTLDVQAIDPRIADLMTMWAARAGAALSEDARDHGDLRAAAGVVDRLDEFIDRRHRHGLGPLRKQVAGADLEAVAAVLAAERARCTGVEDATLWDEAAARCHDAELYWEEWLSLVRLAGCWALAGHSRRDLGPLLRELHGLALGQRARPMAHRVEELARLASVSLDETRTSERRTGMLGSLTPREEQVLEQLVAGRTYAEIATDLVISEKTVSVHVSHLLRKTGTSSRREVAELAARLGG